MAKVMKSGHKQIYCGIDPQTHKEIWKYEHRLKKEKALGRKLRSDEIIHHKDGNAGNNSGTNLSAPVSRGKHNALDPELHHGGRKKKG